MSKNLLDLRFVIKDNNNYTSSIWRIWLTKKGDIYLCTKGMGGIIKYSFHRSGICRNAFTSEHGKSPKLEDRAVYKWIRAPIPKKGEGKATRLAMLAFPTDHLSKLDLNDTTNVLEIKSAVSKCATYVEICMTSESKDDILKVMGADSSYNLVTYTIIDDDKALYISYHYDLWENEDFTMPGNGEVNDLVFPAFDKEGTGRPIRMISGSEPKDGDALILKEIGGYAVSK
jgi:hypothetical protein